MSLELVTVTGESDVLELGLHLDVTRQADLVVRL